MVVILLCFRNHNEVKSTVSMTEHVTDKAIVNPSEHQDCYGTRKHELGPKGLAFILQLYEADTMKRRSACIPNGGCR